MDVRRPRKIGVMLGVVGVSLTVLYLYVTIELKTTNWYFLVMLCGMVLLLLYTVSGKR